MRNLLKIAFTGAALLFTVTAQAGMASYTQMGNNPDSNFFTTALSDYDYDPARNTWESDSQSSDVRFAGFDSSLGQLQKVVVQWESDWMIDQAFNSSGWNRTIARARGIFRVRVVIDGEQDRIRETLRTVCNSNNCDGFEEYFGVWNDSFEILDNLAFFESTFRVRSTNTVRADIECRGTGTVCMADAGSEWAGWTSVTYHYDAYEVPEPGTLGLLGLGIFGVFAARKKAA